MKNYFVGGSLNRVPERRTDGAWIRERLRSPDTAVVLLRESRILFRDGEGPGAAFWRLAAWEGLLDCAREAVLLGEDSGKAYFAVELKPGVEVPSEGALEGAEFRDLKRVATRLERAEGAVLAYARAITYWHRRHRFCGLCGGGTSPADGGHLRICDDPDCGARHFPRTDPAIIVLVTRRERCLLVRQPEWPPRHFATVAGFVEPGEALEDAVRREVGEEVGLEVRELRYHSSQPWPFPGSIMLGFVAEAEPGEVVMDPREIVEFRWFTRPELEAAREAGEIDLPPRVSVSFNLINDWYAADSRREAGLEPGHPRSW